MTFPRSGDKVAGNFFQRWRREPSQTVQASALGGSIDGMLSEYAVLEEDGVVKIPAPFDRGGATLPCALTAWHAMCSTPATIAGQTVLRRARAVFQYLACSWHAMGVAAIITSSSDDKLNRAGQWAARTINYKTAGLGKSAVNSPAAAVSIMWSRSAGGARWPNRSAIRIGGKISMIGG